MYKYKFTVEIKQNLHTAATHILSARIRIFRVCSIVTLLSLCTDLGELKQNLVGIEDGHTFMLQQLIK